MFLVKETVITWQGNERRVVVVALKLSWNRARASHPQSFVRINSSVYILRRLLRIAFPLFRCKRVYDANCGQNANRQADTWARVRHV